MLATQTIGTIQIPKFQIKGGVFHQNPHKENGYSSEITKTQKSGYVTQTNNTIKILKCPAGSSIFSGPHYEKA